MIGDDGAVVVLMVAALLVTGALAGRELTMWLVCRPAAEKADVRERAMRDSIDDLGHLMHVQRREQHNQLVALGIALRDAVFARAEAEARLRAIEAERDELSLAVRGALLSYGRQVARADAAEQAECDRALAAAAVVA